MILLCCVGALCLAPAVLHAEGMPWRQVVITSAKDSKQTRHFQVELALTPAQQTQGLMYRQELADNAGMLFDFKSDGMRYFWMKNTFIPLDILFIGSDMTIRHIHAFAEPQDETPIPSQYPARYVLEIPAGSAERFSIEIGDNVKISDMPTGLF